LVNLRFFNTSLTLQYSSLAMSLKFRFLALLISTFNSLAIAQDNAEPEQFSVYEVNGKAYLYWVITAGTSCNGIAVERSESNAGFQEIYDIPGVCGSVSSPQAYDFTDQFPLTNKPSYYRLRLGNGGYSQTQSITIFSISDDGYLILPNPVSSNTSIYFENKKSEEKTLLLHSSSGTQLMQETTRDNNFRISANNLAAGVYLFSISSPGSTVNGRFIVAR
jgi:hypothetical protein